MVHTAFFVQSILRKIINIVAIRCQILRLKCTKFDFGWGWGSAPDPSWELTALHQTRLWFLRNGLGRQLNADKSEVVILGTSHQLRAAANIQKIDVAGGRLAVSDRVKSLGVTIDSHFRFD